MEWMNASFSSSLPTRSNCNGQQASILHSYQTNENPSRPFTVMGKFDAVLESSTKIIPATFHVIKGNTNTEPLIGFQTAESLGLVVITNAIRTDPETFTSKLLVEYADLFQGIGKMKGVQVDLNLTEGFRSA